MAHQLNIPTRCVERVLKNKLKLEPSKFRKAHDLRSQQEEARVERAKELRKRVYLPERSFENVHLWMTRRKQTVPMVMVEATITTNVQHML